MKKRLLSAIVSLCLLLTMAPTVAFAAEESADAPVLVEQGDAPKVEEAAEEPAEEPVEEPAVENPAAAPAAEAPAEEPAEKETETPAPEPLPTEIALCSYESKNGEKRASGVSLAEAVTALNENGGGTITVTSSGLLENDIPENILYDTNLDIKDDITIIAQEGKPVTVTLKKPMFRLSTEGTNNGKLTLGQKGMSSDLLTFDGARSAICLVESDPRYDTNNFQRAREVEINDGIRMKHFKRSVIGERYPNKVAHALNVTMHGGEILENGPEEEVEAGHTGFYNTINCMSFYMDGGTIHDNKTSDSIINSQASESLMLEASVKICGDAKIYNNRCHPGEDQVSSTIFSYSKIILSDKAEIYNCEGASSLIWCTKGDITMEGDASVHNCTSIGSEMASSISGVNVTMRDNASIYECTSKTRGVVDAIDSVTMSNYASILNCKTLIVANNNVYSVDGVAVETGMPPSVSPNPRPEEDPQNFISFAMTDYAKISGCSGPAVAGGVYVMNGQAIMSGHAKIEHCSTPNRSEYAHMQVDSRHAAGGIFIANGKLTMKDQSNIDQCSTYGAAGGVYTGTGSGGIALEDQASITNCTNFNAVVDEEFYYFNSYTAGGLCAEESDISIGPDAKITGCKGITGGISCSAGVYNNETTVSALIAGEVSGNQGMVGGGICIPKGTELTLVEPAVIKNNTATVSGGGIALFSYGDYAGQDEAQPSTLTLKGGIITQNAAPLGGGVFVAGKADIPKFPIFFAESTAENAGISNVNLIGGTIANNTAKNPEGGTATEFHGGGLFLAWNTKTNISGAVKIFDNADADNLPNNMYLRKAPDFVVETPVPLPSEQEELNELQKYLANALEAYAGKIADEVIEKTSAEEALTELKTLGLVSENETLTDSEKISRFANFARNLYALPTTTNLPDFITQYKEKSEFTPTYESFNVICAQLITEDTLNAWGRMTYSQLSEYPNDLNLAAKMLGLIKEGETYNGTVTEFADAFVRHSKTNRDLLKLMCANVSMELAVDVDNETFGKWWGVKPATDVLSEPDAHVSVSGSLVGSQIGVITEGAKYGRVVAEGINNYTLTNVDLAIFSSDDPFYDVVRHPYKRNQFILKPRETANNGNGGGGGGSSHSTKYTLTYVSNGGTSYKNETCSDGTNVTLNKTPSRESYIFTGWYADKELTNKIINIKMTGNKTVYAGWKATSVPDMLNGEDHFAYIVGYPDKTVHPQNGITRAEVATIFFRLLTDEVRDANSTQTNTYSDVLRGNWYNHAVSTLSKMGIVKGDSHGKFNPNAPITRAEFAAIAARFDKNTNTSTASFSDIANHWAKDEISASANNGWINGYTDGTFRPNAPITRAEAMALINRVLQRLPESKADLLDGMIQWSDNADASKWYYLAVQEATNSHYDDIKSNRHEKWTKLRETRDWTELEK